MVSKIIQGDCLDVMRNMDSNSIDFIVTDPPYGLNFMGKDWDKGIPNEKYWKEIIIAHNKV
jgi:site-specific DNA-methyltransferase (adenine-specific)